MSCHDDILMGAFHLLLPPFPKVARLLPMGLATFSWGETWGVGEWGGGWRGTAGNSWWVFCHAVLQILTLFSDLALQNPYLFQDLAFKKLCHHYLD